MTFSDCKGNDKLHYEVSSPYFKVNNDGSLVALRNVTAVGKTLFVHARTRHAEDMAELMIVGGKDIQGSSQVTGVLGISCTQGRALELVYHMWKMGLWFIIGRGSFAVCKMTATQLSEQCGGRNSLDHITDISERALPSSMVCTSAVMTATSILIPP